MERDLWIAVSNRVGTISVQAAATNWRNAPARGIAPARGASPHPNPHIHPPRPRITREPRLSEQFCTMLPQKEPARHRPVMCIRARAYAHGGPSAVVTNLFDTVHSVQAKRSPADYPRSGACAEENFLGDRRRTQRRAGPREGSCE